MCIILDTDNMMFIIFRQNTTSRTITEVTSGAVSTRINRLGTSRAIAYFTVCIY